MSHNLRYARRWSIRPSRFHLVLQTRECHASQDFHAASESFVPGHCRARSEVGGRLRSPVPVVPTRSSADLSACSPLERVAGRARIEASSACSTEVQRIAHRLGTATSPSGRVHCDSWAIVATSRLSASWSATRQRPVQCSASPMLVDRLVGSGWESDIDGRRPPLASEPPACARAPGHAESDVLSSTGRGREQRHASERTVEAAPAAPPTVDTRGSNWGTRPTLAKPPSQRERATAVQTERASWVLGQRGGQREANS